jgi:uncharacterized membrane protein
MHAELLLLRLVHILGGIFWVGSSIFTTFFLFPAMASAGPAAGQIMGNLAKRRLFVVLPTVAILTILSGTRLLMIASGGFTRDYFTLISGKTYALAAIASTVAFLLSVIVARPAAVRVGVLAQLSTTAGPGDRDRIAAEMRALQARVKTSSIIAMALLLFAAAGMAVARYL